MKGIDVSEYQLYTPTLTDQDWSEMLWRLRELQGRPGSHAIQINTADRRVRITIDIEEN